MAEDWGAADESAPVVVAPEVQDIKLFGKWSTDDVQVSDISLTVSAFIITIIFLLRLDLYGRPIIWNSIWLNFMCLS